MGGGDSPVINRCKELIGWGDSVMQVYSLYYLQVGACGWAILVWEGEYTVPGGLLMGKLVLI